MSTANELGRGPRLTGAAAGGTGSDAGRFIAGERSGEMAFRDGAGGTSALCWLAPDRIYIRAYKVDRLIS